MTNTGTTLICLPFAGGSTNCFGPLQKYWPSGLRTKEVGLPGRGHRYHEPLLKNMEGMVADIWPQISPLLHRPYALFGHSMGSLLAYLLCHKIRQAGLPPPLHLFLSGREAPSVPQAGPLDHLLPFHAFKEKLEGYGGFAPEILQHEDAFAFFEPMIRADFQAIETWQYRPRPRLDVPATIFSGTEEDMTPAEVHAWQSEFNTQVKFEVFPGGHFFIFEQAKGFVNAIAECLQSDLALA